MKSTQKIRGLSALAILLLVVSAVIFAFGTVNSGFAPISVVNTIIEIILCVIALVYAIHGFGKKYARHYKFYFMLVAASYVLEYFFAAFDTANEGDYAVTMISAAIDFVCFGAYVLLAFAEDLGRKKSLIAVWLPFPLYIIGAVYSGVSCLLAPGDSSFLYLVWELIGLIPSCLMDVILVYGKYADKALRKGDGAD